MKSFLELVGLLLLAYVIAAAFFFFLSVATRGAQGGYEAIDTFFFYLSDSTRQDFADLLINWLRGK